MLVLLAGGSGRDQVGNALGQVAVVLGAFLVDSLLDELSLLGCGPSAFAFDTLWLLDVRLSKPVRQIFSP